MAKSFLQSIRDNFNNMVRTVNVNDEVPNNVSPLFSRYDPPAHTHTFTIFAPVLCVSVISTCLIVCVCMSGCALFLTCVCCSRRLDMCSCRLDVYVCSRRLDVFCRLDVCVCVFSSSGYLCFCRLDVCVFMSSGCVHALSGCVHVLLVYYGR